MLKHSKSGIALVGMPVEIGSEIKKIKLYEIIQQFKLKNKQL